MATAEVTPSIEAPIVDTPVSTETPSTPSTETTTETAPVSTETFSPETFKRLDNETDVDFISRYREEKAKHTPKQEPEVKAEPEVKVEEPKQEEVTEEPKTEIKTEPEEADDDFLQELGIMTPKDLSDKAKEIPELNALKEKHPELWNGVMATLRKAGQAAPFAEIFPDKEAAEFARDEASVFTGFREAFVGQKDSTDTRSLLENIARLTVLVDEDGNPVKDVQGNVQTDGSFTRFMDNVRQIEYDFLRQQAEKNKDEELLAALDTIRERTSPSSQAQGEMPEATKAAIAKFEHEKAEFDKKKEGEVTSQRVESDKRVQSLIDSKFDYRWAAIEKKCALPKVVLDALKDKVIEAVGSTLEQNRLFISQRTHLMGLPVSKKTEQRRAELANKYVGQVFNKIAAPILKEAGLGVIAQGEAKQKTIEALKTQSRSDIKGATATAVPSRPQTNKEILEQYAKENPNASAQDYARVLRERSTLNPR